MHSTATLTFCDIRWLQAMAVRRLAYIFILLLGCDEGKNYRLFTDERDGRIYKTVKMPDGKVWFAENLNYKIEKPLHNENDDYDLLPGNYYKYGNSWCNENDSNCEKYGRLYDWETAMNACPNGWHLPSKYEWFGLVTVLGDSIAGKKLKSKTGWGNNGNGTDDFGFSALPNGYRYNIYIPANTLYNNLDSSALADKFGVWLPHLEGDSSNYFVISMPQWPLRDSSEFYFSITGPGDTIGFAHGYELGTWWSSTEGDSSEAYFINMGIYDHIAGGYTPKYDSSYSLNHITGGYTLKSSGPSYFGFSVRCVRSD